MNHRELDVRVAAILGQSCPPTLGDKHYDWEELDDGTWRGTHWLDTRFYEEVTWPPRYRTNIAAAWRVVEWLAEKGYYVGVSFLPKHRQWRCVIYSDAAWIDEIEKTAPEAICAALTAARWV